MKWTSTFLSLLFLCQSFGFEVNDFVQIDEFIEHAKYHNQEYGDSFTVFISKHYGDLKSDHNKEHQEEKSDHEQLPFQHIMYISGIAVLSLMTPQIDNITTEFKEVKSHNFFYQESSSVSFSEGPFQPPRHI